MYLNIQNYEVERIEDRGLDFTEQRAHWTLPQFFHTNLVTDIAVKRSKFTCILDWHEGVRLKSGSPSEPVGGQTRWKKVHAWVEVSSKK